LASSTKVALRIAESGVMGIQFLIPIPDTAKMAFVEFYVSGFYQFKVLLEFEKMHFLQLFNKGPNIFLLYFYSAYLNF